MSGQVTSPSPRRFRYALLVAVPAAIVIGWQHLALEESREAHDSTQDELQERESQLAAESKAKEVAIAQQEQARMSTTQALTKQGELEGRWRMTRWELHRSRGRLAKALTQLPGREAEALLTATRVADESLQAGSVPEELTEGLIAAVNATRKTLPIYGTTAPLSFAYFSSDGALILADGDSNQARLLDAQSGATLATFANHHGDVRDAAFSPGADQILTASADGQARLWDSHTGELKATFAGHEAQLNDLAFSPEGSLVATASADHTVRLWSLSTSTALHSLEGHEGEVNAVAFSPDGLHLASCGEDQKVLVWSVRTGALELELSGHQAAVNGAVFAPSGRSLASYADDSTAIIWDLNTGEIKERLVDHLGPLRSLQWSRNGRRILTSSSDGTAKLWKTEDGSPLITYKGHTQGLTQALLSPNEEVVATASLDASVRLWSTDTGRPLMRFQGHSDGVSSVDFGPDGKRLVSASLDSSLRLWAPEQNPAQASFEGHLGPINALRSMGPDSLITASDDRTARIWNLEEGRPLTTLKGHTAAVNTIALDKERARILTGSEDRTARLWDPHSGASLRIFVGHSDEVNGLYFIQDGERVLSTSLDGTARLWQTEDARALFSFKARAPILAATLNDDQSQLILGTERGTLFSWHLVTGRALHRVALGQSPIIGLGAFDAGYFAMTKQGLLIFLDAELRLRFSVITSWRSPTWSLSPDRQWLAVELFDGSLALWPTMGGEAKLLHGSEGEDLVQVRFSNDGERLVAGTARGRVHLWDSRTEQHIAAVDAHPGAITALAFTQEGDSFVTAGADGLAHLYPASVRGFLTLGCQLLRPQVAAEELEHCSDY